MDYSADGLIAPEAQQKLAGGEASRERNPRNFVKRECAPEAARETTGALLAPPSRRTTFGVVFRGFRCVTPG